MAYDETLAVRITRDLQVCSGVVERKMFGGLVFMVHGNMCCGVMDDRLMVRVGADAYEDALDQPHAGLVNFTGRPMKGSVLVECAGLATDADLAVWLRRGLDFVDTLPPK
jgi:TfoX/Sxy family transcriptional regulator of competence genes